MGTKETFELLAAYNAQTNREVIQLLRRLAGEELTAGIGSHFGSVLGIMNHLLASDVLWLRSFTASFPELREVASLLPEFEPERWRDVLWADLDTLAPVREHVDELIVRVFRLLPEAAHTAVLPYSNTKGLSQERLAWRTFLHFFNHQTHHRGQVSLALDQRSVENDYSNLIWRF